ncbi:MAG: zinc ABC transporter substrate-binding protein [Veillonellales bacterium]
MSKFLRIMLVCLTAAAFIVSLAGCGSRSNSTQASGEKIKIVATMYPVYEFAKQVGKDKVAVTMLVPPGAEPHDWEPTPKDLAQIRTAKLFLYHGANLEPVDKLLTKEVLGTTTAVEISKGIPLLTKTAEAKDETKEPQEDHDQHHSGTDTHVWLDPLYAQQEINNIAAALAAIDPQNKEYYQDNARQYNSELEKLNQEYQTALANVPHRDIIASHDAFGYLAKRYNLRQVAIMGLNPDTEPTPDKMAKVVNFCREHQVKYIFFETVVNPKLSQTIAKETGAGLLVLNPVESLSAEEMKQGKNYLSIMRENLVNLQTALE